MNVDEDSSVLDILEPAESILQTKKQTRMDGYLYRLEQRPIIGMNKKKYWFVLPIDTPVLYWYKSPNDINCAGRIVLSGAAFTFNPREYGTFEIHVDNKCYVLEASDNKIRVDWLSGLQYNRKQYYQKTLQNGEMNGNEPKEEFTFPEIGASSSTNKESSAKLEQSVHDANNSAEEDHQTNSRTLPVSIPTAHSPLMNENESRSTFYLREDGELHPGSLEIPPPIHNIQSIEELLNKVTEEANQLELPTTKFIKKARNSLRTISQTSHSGHGQPNLIFPLPKENCDRCSEFSQTMEQLRNRCYELADDLVVYQDLVISLKKSVVAAHNERDALQRYCVDASSDMDKLAFVIERESNLTKMQFTQSQLRREIENLRAENRMLESENCSLNATVEAYQESVRTKEELILRYAEQQNQNNNQQQEKPSNQSNSFKNGGQSSQQQIPRIGSQPIPFFCTSPEVTEALLVDFGTPTDIAAKNVFKETDVNDLNEMQDLIDGYRNQNKFLNNEVIELQKIIQALEDRERRLIRQNFTLEAFYYQLKTKYIMLLNHFRSSDQPRRVIEPSVIQDLINEVSRPHSPMRMHNANNSLALETMRSPSALAAFISNPRGIPITAYEDLNGGILRNKDPETDSLGFYLTSPRSRKAILQAKMEAEEGKGGQQLEMEEEIKITEGFEGEKKEEHSPPPKLSQSFYESGGQQNMGSPNAEEMAHNSGSAPSTSYFAYFNELNEKPLQPTKDKDWLLKMAADSQKRSEEILSSIEPGNNQEFVDWLARWDAFLVNHVLQPMSRQPQLKTLVRCGIPHAYRSRVWSGLVDFLVGPLQVETGKGYYECLLRKSHRLNSEEDSALKQIDLDLARTLPNNKLFETEQSPKAGELKNILYAFRSHNKNVEYCQGLNRIGAIGLLYLEESQAFWFLVACVERLQPANYYSSNLVGAVIDQRVLLDLVQDKMPSLHSHLQKLEVNLSLFTLSWFLTIFVDVLSHNVYIKIFDVFLYEGNKVLFRFALAILRLVESRLMECSSFSGVHTCLSNLSSMITDYKALAKIAFNTLNPFPAKLIESRRQNYYLQHKSGKFKI